MPTKKKVGRQKMIESVFSLTHAGNAPKKKMSEKAKKLSAIIQSSEFGCAKEPITKLIGAMIGEDVSAAGLKFRQYSTVVALNNNDDHDYGLEKPVMLVENAEDDNWYAWKVTPGGWRKRGNLLNVNHVRLATKEEIRGYINALNDQSYSKLLEGVKSDFEICRSVKGL